MKVAVIGLPQSGKTTLFHSLAGADSVFEKGGLTMGMVRVPDTRVDHMTSVFNPKKTVYAQIEVVEAQARSSSSTGKGLDGAFMNAVKPMDALLLVTRAFDGEGLCEPAEDVARVIEEMILTDQIVVENRLERLNADKGKGKPVSAEELALLEKALPVLESGRRLFDEPELATHPALRNFSFVSAKPLLVVMNVSDDDAATTPDTLMARFGLPVRGVRTFPVAAKVEEEIRDLPPEERTEFLAAMGIDTPALHRIINEIYTALGLISFLTVGEDEVRAWTIRRGTLAPQAAGTIHSDMEKGFIRAEVIGYTDFVALGSEAAARKAGKYRLEGKEYPVTDGDIVNVRFNV